MITLKIDNIVKTFGKKRALDHVSLEITGTFGLLGPNGAGKTTLMRLIATLDTPDSGKIELNDLSWTQPHQVRKLLGYLPQHFSIYKSLNVCEVMNHFAVLKGISEKEERKREINHILEAVNLQDQKNKKIRALSGGMLRRLGIAQAILGDPKMVIVDEPTAGLDVQERVRFCKLLRRLAENRIIILSTHIVEDLEATCDHIAIINEGKVITSGTRRELTKHADGHIWEMDSPMDADPPIPEQAIISTVQQGDHYRIRFYHDTELPDAGQVEPNLEDAYLYYMKEADHV